LEVCVDVPGLTQEASALFALVDAERARVARSLPLVRTLDGGALLLLSEARHQALRDIDLRATKLAALLKDAPTPRPPPLAQALSQLGESVASLRQENQRLMPLLQQALSLVIAYSAALPGAPSIYNRRGQRPATAEPRVRHSSRA
jgi:hypothetical protein